MTHSNRQNILDLGFSRHGGRTIKRAVDAVLCLSFFCISAKFCKCGLGLGSSWSRVIVFAVFVSAVTSRPPKRHARRSSREAPANARRRFFFFFFFFFLPFLLFFSPTLTFTFSVSPPLCRLAYSLQLHLLTVSSHLLNNPPPSRAWHSTGTPPPLLHTTPLSSPSRLHLPISLVGKGKIQRYSSVPCLTCFRSFLTVLTIPGFPPSRF